MILKSYFFVSFYPKNHFTSQCSIYVLSRRILGMIYFILVCSHWAIVINQTKYITYWMPLGLTKKCSHVWAIHVCCSGRCAITYLHFPWPSIFGFFRIYLAVCLFYHQTIILCQINRPGYINCICIAYWLSSFWRKF